jgi:ATP-dependent DNA helicase RecQ
MQAFNQTDDWSRMRSALRTIWGYEDFRSPQGEIIQCLLTGQDALVVMPTGGGKSICFQLPALMQHGLTLVVSPLVALMENQVQELQQRRLPAALLHSEVSAHQRRQTLRSLEKQTLRLLYLSPETLLSETVWQQLCQPNLQINGLVLDEAHCLVQWGDTFRPAYRRLGAVRPALLRSKPPGTRMAIAAFTATADPTAQQTIQQVLQLQQPQQFLQNPYRANLSLSVQTVWTPRGRRQHLLKFIQAHPHQTGLVYVRTRRDGEELAEWLQQQGYRTAAYHAGLSPQQRRQIEAAWMVDQLQFVVCTSAFGMGVNKPTVRWVLHYHAPILLSEYVQEVGRAGRDGKPAQALTLISEATGWFNPDDRQRQRYFLDRVRSQQQTAQTLMRQLPTQGNVKEISRQWKEGAIALSLLHSMEQLEWSDPFHYVIQSSTRASGLTQDKAAQAMMQYLHSKRCRWQVILSAFGFAQDGAALSRGCGHCDRCSRS